MNKIKELISELNQQYDCGLTVFEKRGKFAVQAPNGHFVVGGETIIEGMHQHDCLNFLEGLKVGMEFIDNPAREF